jgi:acyl-CoA synthetase (AMP-forming)/AMP-acid ligase II
VNPASRTPLADGQVGEIWVAGPHVATGYWNDAPATDADFGAGLAPAERGAFLRTGDLGFMLDGEIYVTGRRKSIIVHRGGNIQPEDIEDSVRGSHAVYADAGVAFAIEEAGDEQVVVAFEIQRVEADSAGSFRAATERALAAVAEDHGLRLYDVVFLPPYALPKTSSGKIQRDRCRALYSAGELGSLAPDLRHPSLGRYAAPATDGAGSGTTA